MHSIQFANTREEKAQCFALLQALRPHLSLDTFLESSARLATTTGYQLLYLSDPEVKAVAGMRISEWLHTGRYLEIEELITREEDRSKGYGSQLFDWICQYAKTRECNQVRLVSGVSRTRAHEFYEAKGMVYEAKYFSLNL